MELWKLPVNYTLGYKMWTQDVRMLDYLGKNMVGVAFSCKKAIKPPQRGMLEISPKCP